jgi:predicted phage terminase large subunit-like protein
MMWHFTKQEEPEKDPNEEISLWEWKQPLDVLKAKKNSPSRVTRMNFATQYMQKPAPEEGNLFLKDKVGRWEVKPTQFRRNFTCVDTGQGVKEENDPTAMGYFEECNDGLYWLDYENEVMDIVTAKNKLIRLDDIHKPGLHIIEQQANGYALQQLIQSERILPIQMFDASISRNLPSNEKGKSARAELAAPFWNQAWIKIPKLLQWGHDIVDQCANFPNSAHDELVDLLSMAVIAGRLILPLHPAYNSSNHLRQQLSTVPAHLLYVWNVNGNPSVMLAQITAYNQLRIIDFDMIDNNQNVDQFVDTCIRKHQPIFQKTRPLTINVICNELDDIKRQKFNIMAFHQTLSRKYNLFPIVNKNIKMKKERLYASTEQLNKLLLENVYDHISGFTEPKFVISNNAKVVDRALCGGITLDQKVSQHNMTSTWELSKISPHYEIAQCLYHLIYYFYMKLENDRQGLQNMTGDAATGRPIGTSGIKAVY